MTVEQLNIIITAQTTDFQEKLAAVNEALRETASLAQQAAAYAAALTGASVSVTGTAMGESADVRDMGKESAVPSAPAHRRAEDIGTEQGYESFEEYAAANVPELERGQTVIGAFAENGAAGKGGTPSGPIEIHTTVELDGDRLGEAIAAYNGRMSRITDGFYGS